MLSLNENNIKKFKNVQEYSLNELQNLLNINTKGLYKIKLRKII